MAFTYKPRVNTTLTVCPTCGTSVGPCYNLDGSPRKVDHPERLMTRTDRRRLRAAAAREWAQAEAAATKKSKGAR
jgi:hypothetical protein